MYRRVNEIHQEAVDEKDATISINGMWKLIQLGRLSGLGLGRFIYLLRRDWELFERNEPLEDVVFDHLGFSKTYITRCERIARMHMEEYIPLPYREAIEDRPIKDQQAIANALEQGYEIDEMGWEELADAADNREVLKIVRERIKDRPPRKDYLSLTMDRDGDIWAWKNGDRHWVGQLDINANDEVVQKAVSRIENNSGIRRQ